MTIEEKFEKFDQSHREAIETIKEYQQDKDVGVLVNWLLATDINPYSFLDDEYAQYMYTSEGFSMLCHLLHHALIDDGDVTFLSVDKKPKIGFYWKYDLPEFTRKDYKLIRPEDGSRPYIENNIVLSDVIVYDDFNQFIEAIEIYATNDLKRCFLGDIQIMDSLDNAVRHYSQYKRFDPAWIELYKKGDSEDE